MSTTSEVGKAIIRALKLKVNDSLILEIFDIKPSLLTFFKEHINIK